MDGRILVIVNPIAGRGRAERLYPHVRDRLLAAGVTHDTVRTTGPGHAQILAREASSDGYTTIAAMGGDGTLSEVVNGVMEAVVAGAETKVAVAAVPSGSGNDFVGGSGFSLDPMRAVDALLRPRIRPMDVMSFVDSAGSVRYAVNSVGFGYDAYVVHRVTKMSSRRMGHLQYLVEALGGLLHFNPEELSISMDGSPAQTYDQAWLFAITNGERFGGGMRVSPGAVPDDGLLNTAILGGIPRRKLVSLLMLVRSGRHAGKPGVTLGTTARARILAPPGFPCHVDGDPVDAIFPVTVSVLKGALPFVVGG